MTLGAIEAFVPVDGVLKVLSLKITHCLVSLLLLTFGLRYRQFSTSTPHFDPLTLHSSKITDSEILAHHRLLILQRLAVVL